MHTFPAAPTLRELVEGYKAGLKDRIKPTTLASYEAVLKPRADELGRVPPATRGPRTWKPGPNAALGTHHTTVRPDGGRRRLPVGRAFGYAGPWSGSAL